MPDAQTVEPTPNTDPTANSGASASASTPLDTAGAAENPAAASEQHGEVNAEDASSEEGSGEDESGDAESEEGEAAAAATKKKKRRRKKKKPAAAAADGTTDPNAPKAAGAQARASDRTPFRVGEEVYGKVTAVLDHAVMIDLSGKALAVFDRGEMAEDDLVPSIGDRFVAHVHNDGARGGLVVLTRKPLREEEAKPVVEKAHQEGTLIKGLVTGVIKGGVEVDIDGLRAFAPASGMDLHPANANFTNLVGQRLDFKVIQYEKHGRDVVVTRRPMLEAEAHERRKQALTLLTEGQVMDGVVRTVVEWGAFVAMPAAENLEGLVHISEASHDPRARPADLFRPGEKLQVKIIKIDEKGKIWLSRKALVDDPWAVARERYAPGTRHQGKVTRLEDFGAFIELENGIDGLLHVADLAFDRVEHPKEKLEVGQQLDVVVAHFDARNRKIALHPALTGAQAEETAQRIARNQQVKVEIVKIENSGLVVRVLGATGRGARGFIPAGQTGTPRGTELRKSFKLNAVIDAKVIDVDPKRGEPRLSIRELAEDEERRATREYRQKLNAQGGFGTLGDLFRNKLSGN
ncbi:MAG: S1 RNA-binding domain-containing protein [Polyangiaceae bacterium]